MATFISVVMPVRNESERIAELLDRLLEQHYPSEFFEILVVDGRSTDSTRSIVQQYVERCPNVRLFDNPGRLSSFARNIGAKNARGDIILVVDGHCLIDYPKMFQRMSDTFEKTGADCLGRPQPLEMKNATKVQWAIAMARRSWLGHHPLSFIYADEPQRVPASSVAVAYRRSVFEKIGYFDERFDACEDVEFNTRIDKSGLVCFFDPQIAVRYEPRKTISGLFYQMVRYGKGRTRLYRKHPETFSVNSFAPGLFLTGLFAGPLCCFLAFLFFQPLFWSLLMAYVGIILLYLVVVATGTIQVVWKQRRFDLLPLLPVVFFAIHFGVGYGVVMEMLSFRRYSGASPFSPS